MLKIAHLSDLHFSKLKLSPSQFLSKQWLGNLNLLFSRKKKHNTEQLQGIVDILIKEKVNVLFIAGDLTTTSRKTEYLQAKKWVDHIESLGIKVLLIPGNHDHYTRKSYKEKRFYQYFENKSFPPVFKDLARSLETEKIAAYSLDKEWQCVCIDAVIPTELWASTGLFSKKMEKTFREVLKKLPQDKKTLVLCHFPYFCTDTLRKRLIGREFLKELLEEYVPALYLHGHTHNQSIAKLYPTLPSTLDSGSCSHVKTGSFHILDLTQSSAMTQVYRMKKGTWTLEKTLTLPFFS